MVDTYAVAGGPTPQALVVGVRKLSLKQSKIKNRRASLSSFRANVTSLPAGIGDVRLAASEVASQ